MSRYARLLGFLRPYRGRVAAGAVCALGVAAATSAYAYLAGPMLKLLVVGDSLPEIAKARGWSRNQLLGVLPFALVAVALFRGTAQFGYAVLIQGAGHRLVSDLRRALFSKFLDLSPAFHDRNKSGELLSRFVADVQALEHAATFALTSYLRDGVQVVALLATCAALNLRLLLVGLLAAPFAALLIGRFARSLQKVTGQVQASLGRITQRASEASTHVRVIQAYRAERTYLAKVDDEIGGYMNLMRRSFALRAAFTPVLEVMAVLGLAAAMAVATGQINRGALSAEQFLSFIAALLFMYQPVKALVGTGQVSMQGLAAADRVFDVIDAPSEVRESPVAVAIAPFTDSIVFDSVSLAYGDAQALDRITFSVRRGETVALVGASGGGKTSIVSVLFRFYDPQTGRVVIDGVDLRGVTLESLRSQMALVTQEPFLFSGTIGENIACAKPAAGGNEIETAARAAQAWEFIEKMPHGLDSPVGERGSLLSGGQRQRVAMARAFLKAAPILVLDEATSSLDLAGEVEVQKGLAELSQGKTVLVIAHRLSTVKNATRILVVERGHIVEEGSHEELRAKGGVYARLWSQGAA